SLSRVSREYLADNQWVRVKRTVTPLMWITRLVAAGDDRTGRKAARAQDRRINFGTERFRSQSFAVPAQSFSGSRLGPFQNFNGAFESLFSYSQGSTHHFHFLF